VERSCARFASVLATVVVPAALTGTASGQTDLPDYPKDALAAGVGGAATLICERTEHGALAACRILDETPDGKGFGAAALALAGKSAEGCGSSLPPAARGPRPIRFTFTATSPAVVPDPRREGWILASPRWRRLPLAEHFLRFYPERAAHDRVEGEAIVQCVVGGDGRMKPCDATAENPMAMGSAKLRFDFPRSSPSIQPCAVAMSAGPS